MSKNELTVSPQHTQMPVSELMLNELKQQRALLMQYVSSQLVKDVDYGVIPGTKKPSLYKPGAEKLRTLFSLSVKVDMVDKELDRIGNFAMFTYKATVSRNGTLLAECDGACNSQEKKYKERTSWIYDVNQKKKVPKTEVTPVCDILNTLQKMAQKRAFVGAILLACGASDFFTQDIDDPEDAQTIGAAAKDVTESAVPNVVNVSAKPKENNQSLVTIIAKTDYENRHLPKEAGFKWDKDNKIWTKRMAESDYNPELFPFETEIAG